MWLFVKWIGDYLDALDLIINCGIKNEITDSKYNKKYYDETFSILKDHWQNYVATVQKFFHPAVFFLAQPAINNMFPGAGWIATLLYIGFNIYNTVVLHEKFNLLWP